MIYFETLYEEAEWYANNNQVSSARKTYRLWFSKVIKENEPCSKFYIFVNHDTSL